MGEESGVRIDIILEDETKFPKPTFKNAKLKTPNKRNNSQILPYYTQIKSAYRTAKFKIDYYMEAPPRFELGIEVLQTSALPLGYSAIIIDINWSG